MVKSGQCCSEASPTRAKGKSREGGSFLVRVCVCTSQFRSPVQYQ